MKKGILAVVVVAVLAVGAIVAFKVMRPGPGGVVGPSGVERSVTEVVTSKGQVAIADVVPSDVVLFLSARNARATWDLIKNSNFWKQTSALKIWEAAQLGTNLATFKEQFQKNMGFELSEENVLGLFGQDLSLALVGSKEGLANPQLLLLAQTDPRVDMMGKMNLLLEKVKPNVTIETVEYNGQKITRIRNPQVPGPEFNYSFLGGVFALGIGIDDSGIRKVVDLVSKKSSESLGTSTQYQDAVGALKVRGDLRGVVFVNMAKIVDLIKALPTPEGTPTGFLEGLEQTLGAIQSISGAIGFDRGMLVKLFFLKNKEAPETELFTGWEAAPKEAESLSFLPEGSLLLTVSNSIDFAKIWDAWQANLETQNPEQSKVVKEGIATFEKDSGINIKEEILNWLGEEVCFAITQVDMGGLFPFPHIAILAKVKDDQKTLETMKRLSDYAVAKSAPVGVTPATAAEAPAVSEAAPGEAAPATAAEPGETPAEATSAEGETPQEAAPAAGAIPAAPPLAQVTVGEEEYNGITIHYLEINMPYQTLNPSYAVVNHFLVVGVNKDTVKNIIDVAKGSKGAVTQSKAFRESTANFSPKVNQVAFLNMERTLDVVIEITKWANNLQKARGEAGAQTDKVIQENVIPFLESLRIFKAVAVEAVNQESGIEETMFVQMEDLKES